MQDKQAKLKELQDQFGNYVGDDEELADTKKVLTEAQTKLTQAQKNQADAQKDYDNTPCRDGRRRDDQNSLADDKG